MGCLKGFKSQDRCELCLGFSQSRPKSALTLRGSCSEMLKGFQVAGPCELCLGFSQRRPKSALTLRGSRSGMVDKASIAWAFARDDQRAPKLIEAIAKEWWKDFKWQDNAIIAWAFWWECGRERLCVFVCIKKPGPVFLLKIIVHASLERDLTLGSPSPIPNDDDDDADD